MFTKVPHLVDQQLQELLQSSSNQEGHYNDTNSSGHKGGGDVTHYLDKKEFNSLQSRSTKPKAGDFDISFEAEFFDEHLSALVYQTKNLVELSLKNQNIISLNSETQNPFNSQAEKHQINILQNELLSPHSRRQFIKDLENEEKLNQFLTKICEDFSAQVSDQLVFLAYFFWEKYLQIRKPFLSQSSLLSSALKFCVDLPQFLQKSGISFLNFRAFESAQLAPKKDIEKNVEEYLVFFGSTVFLIVEGYFQNPFTEEEANNGKRNRQDDDIFGWDDFCESSEQQCERPPTKLVKFV